MSRWLHEALRLHSAQVKAFENNGPNLNANTPSHCPHNLTQIVLWRNYSAHFWGVKLMFYFKYFIQLADLHSWHNQLKAWQSHIFILHSLLNRSQDSPKENINQAHLTLTSLHSAKYVPFSAEPATYTEGQMSSKVGKPLSNSKEFPHGHQGMLSATRQRRKLNETAGSSSWDKAEERTEHADTNRRGLTTCAMMFCTMMSKAPTKHVTQQTVLAFQLSSTVARKCQLLLGDEEIRSGSQRQSLQRWQTCLN